MRLMDCASRLYTDSSESEKAMFNSLETATRLTKLLFLGLILVVLFGFVGQAHGQCTNPANEIVAENCLPGNPDSEWDVKTGDAGDPTIQGFATDISVNRGSTISFKISTPATAYTINIYRMGYYGGTGGRGMGARLVKTISPSVHLPQNQPACVTDEASGLIDCGNWAVSASWAVPANATSGIYFAHLVRTDTGGDSHIVFIVRNDSSHSAIVYQTSDETWQAYNYYGKGSLYSQASPTWDLNGRSYKVSYNRPFMTRGFAQEWDTWLFGPEFPMIQWLEANGYDVTYISGVDAARSGTLIKNHKIFMDSGHDEYWSGTQRANVEAARDAGVNLAFFSGNGVFWKTRWENSIDGSNTPNRTLVCYKETLAFAKIDSSDPTMWTGTWRDPTFSPPADGGKPENALTGSLFMVNGTSSDNDGSLTMKVPSADGKMRFWRNTAVATLAPNSTYTLPTGSLGYEWDVDADNGFRPAGAFHLSTSTYTLTADLLLDYGATYGAGVATHHLMLYRAPSGALVFSSGTINWSWGLNSNHDNYWWFDNPDPDPNMQQATVNLFADMGVQPANLQPGVVPASASSDSTSPVSVIATPSSGSAVNTGSAITVTGTASDIGGVVAGVEFSGDGGATWHPATGRSNWSYIWTPTSVGSISIMSRAVDDSGNLENTPHGITVNVAPQNCPCSIWNPSIAPTNADSGDGNAVELGIRFRVDANGSIIGVRFYKAANNKGTHIGHVWSSTGQLLGTATFTNESNSGWQQVNFTAPIQVTANTTYIVSYFAPLGHYSADSYYFEQSGADNPPVHALANGVDGQNGLFVYTPSPGSFPNSSYLAANYWVDVVYTSSNTYNITGTISGYGGAGASVSLSGTETLTTTADSLGNFSFDGLVNGIYSVSARNPGVTFTPTSRPVTLNSVSATGVNFTATVSNPLSISGIISGGAGATVNLGGVATATTTADASGHFSFSGLLNGTYTVTPLLSGYTFTPYTQAVVLSGSNATNVNFQAQVCTCLSIWQPSAMPSLIDSNDSTPIEVGVKFRVEVAGYITGLRFYKADTNTGSHIGHIWSSSGVQLGSAIFTSETASGWQQVNFSTPIAVSPNTTYVASYFAPGGHYSADTNYFAASGVDSPPLHALADGVDGSDGVYLYTSSSGFPSNSYSSTNYWVDVVYNAGQSYSVSGTINGGAGSTITLSGTSTRTTTADIAGNYIFSGVYPGSYSISPSNTGTIFVPSVQNITVAGANVTGVNFATPQTCPCNTIWQPSTLPVVIDQGESQSIELGVKFRADNDGYILGVRFYKSVANTGAHIGNLWSLNGSGTPLATATFTNESSSGWQQVTFSTPVPISANTTYVASYFAPTGHYSANPGFFAGTGADNPPLHALVDGVDGSNGAFSYSSTSAYPSNSYNAANYWVDVIYAPAATYTLAGVITGPAAAGATVNLTGTAGRAITADAAGNYSFTGLVNGTYTITPSKNGAIFSPGSQTVVINGSHNLAVNFTSGLPYSISGTVNDGAGATLALSGTATATKTADASGNYSFPGVANGTYTVTPSAVGLLISPSSQSVTVNGASVTAINFSATAQTYQISGTLSGGAGATVSLSGPATAATTADSSGNYSFMALTNGSYTVTPTRSGVIFIPGNLTAVIYGANVLNANFAVPQNCPCDTLWAPSAIPAVVDVGDTHSTEVGLKFRADADGYITGIRFYKATANSGLHQGNLWSSSGILLGTASFSNEGSSGWQQVIFAKPIPVIANNTYVASYFAPAGHYSADSGFFTASGLDSPPLHALADGIDGQNGVYTYSATSAFPSVSFNAANYWVDVIYTPTSTYSIAGIIGGAGGPGATVSLGGATTSTTADATGAFSFSGLANGSYTVTPSSIGYSYSPIVQNATINNAHVLGLTFSSTQTYSITGTISGAGGPGATVHLGGSTTTATANSSGVYTFTGLANGDYTVTPTKTGYNFTPVGQSVTINGANTTANFGSVSQTYTITGTITGAGGSGATVKLTGAITATVTANASGVYSFTGISSGSYTVTPTKTGYNFTPVGQSVTINGADATVNFSSVSLTYTVSGTISGVGRSGATVKLTGATTATVTANTSGVYTFTGISNGSYTVTPTKTGYSFTPAGQAITVNGANITANFSSAVQTYTISGTISGAGGSGSTVKLTGATTATVTSNASGVYTFTGLSNGNYTVTPAKTGYSFAPANHAITVNGANTTVNFTSAVQTYTITGTISGGGGAGATVKLTGAATVTVTANASGLYTFTGVPNGSYTVTPTKSGHIFIPSSRTTTVNSGNVTGLNFVSL